MVQHPRHKPTLTALKIQTTTGFERSDRILGNWNRVQHEIISDKVFALKKRRNNIRRRCYIWWDFRMTETIITVLLLTTEFCTSVTNIIFAKLPHFG